MGTTAVNILTGGSPPLLKWVGPAEKIGESFEGITEAKKNRRKKEWEQWSLKFDELNKDFAYLVKRLHSKNITESERSKISKKIKKINKIKYRHFDKVKKIID